MDDDVPDKYHVLTVELEDGTDLKNPNIEMQLRNMGITIHDHRVADLLDMSKAIRHMEAKIADTEKIIVEKDRDIAEKNRVTKNLMQAEIEDGTEMRFYSDSWHPHDGGPRKPFQGCTYKVPKVN